MTQRLFDRINRDSARFINPDLLVMNVGSVAQLIEELEDEFDESISLENISKYLGMNVVISMDLPDEFKLASFFDENHTSY